MLQNARAFRLDEPPRAVVGRNAEQQQLARCLTPLADGNPGDPAILVGPAGAGKTTVAKSTADRLREQSLTVDSCFLHCSGGTRYSVLQRLTRSVGVGPAGHGRSAADLLDRLRDLTQNWLVILDEIDSLTDQHVLTDLWEIRALTIVAISNDVERLLAGLHERGRSRVRAMKTISFDSYTDDELVAILQDRADWGLVDRAVSTARLRDIARVAEGDARTAISILHAAAQLAEEDGRTEIARTDVAEEAISRAAAGVTETQLGKLSSHHQLVYEVLERGGECDLATLLDRYRDTAEEPRSKRMVQSYLSDLVDYGLVERLGPKQDRTFVATTPLGAENGVRAHREHV